MAHSLLAGRGGSEKRTYLNKTAREGDRECIKQSRQLTAIEFVRLCFGADNDDVIYSKTLCFVVASLSLSPLQLHWTSGQRASIFLETASHFIVNIMHRYVHTPFIGSQDNKLS